MTETVKREPIWPWRAVPIYNAYPNDIYYEPFDDFPELLNLEVHKDFLKEAKDLSSRFHNLGPFPKKEIALPIVEKLLSLCEPEFGKLSSVRKWDRTAIQIPGDIGGPNKEKFATIITQRCKGNVLETMAGFNTYVLDSPNISEVVALDYSREMLLRYPNPERKRILFDLNRISSEGIKMDFFDKEKFQTITCCYGVNYLEKPTTLFTEFYRVLSPGGKFLVLGNTGAGYSDIQVRPFRPKDSAEEMGLAGFSSSIQSFSEFEEHGEPENYYLITGTK